MTDSDVRHVDSTVFCKERIGYGWTNEELGFRSGSFPVTKRLE